MVKVEVEVLYHVWASNIPDFLCVPGLLCEAISDNLMNEMNEWNSWRSHCLCIYYCIYSFSNFPDPCCQAWHTSGKSGLRKDQSIGFLTWHNTSITDNIPPQNPLSTWSPVAAIASSCSNSGFGPTLWPQEIHSIRGLKINLEGSHPSHDCSRAELAHSSWGYSSRALQ